jgi:hypothetical protein
MAYESKIINRDQVVKYLNHAFSRATQRFGSKNVVGTELYNHQVNYCYLINEIKLGPSYMVPKIIAEANRLIDGISQ